ncbi:MAG: hypothetical protein LBI14_05900 [Treponema sp.]|jgi:hypothetical protein|nr:hypothetical protein [Treponema sp.]
MVYVVISDINYSSDSFLRPDTGTIRFVNKGEIPLPENVDRTVGNHWYNETYFSDYEKAKTNFKQVENMWQRRNDAQVSFSDET